MWWSATLRRDFIFAVVKVKNERTQSNSTRGPATLSHLRLHSGAPVFAAPDVLDKAGAELDPETGEFSIRAIDSSESVQRHGAGHVSERFRAILEVAGMSARGMARYEIEPEDLLMALVNDADCTAAKSWWTWRGPGPDRGKAAVGVRKWRASDGVQFARPESVGRRQDWRRSRRGAAQLARSIFGALASADDGLASKILRDSGVGAEER